MRVPMMTCSGLGVVCAVALTGTAEATIFFDRASFDAANPGLPVLDFEGIAPDGGFIEPTPQPWAPAVLFSDPNGDTSSVAIADSEFFFNTPTDALFMDLFDVPLLGTFDPDVSAVGFDVAIGFGGLQATVDVLDADGSLLETSSFVTEDETIFTTFIGFSDLGDIGSVLITPQSGGFVLIDNFAFGVPAPGALALIGLAGVFPNRRRRRG